MTTLTQYTDINKDFPYTSEPEVNFFLYPPMEPVPGNRCRSLDNALALDQPMPYAPIFSIYVSIPYCRRRCNSCCCFRGFLPDDVDKERFLDDYIKSLTLQIKAYASTFRFSNARCDAIYIGGGTGSVLSPGQIDHLINALRDSFNIAADAEINFEGNPIDFSLEHLEKIRESGVTRLSIGYQSGQNKILKALNTTHTAEMAVKSVKNALLADFKTVNVDLLFNVPGQTEENWHDDVKRLVELGPQNISPGDYIVFSDSQAAKLIKSGVLSQQQSIDTMYEWYLWTCDYLNKNGFYEQVRGIFVKNGHEQRYVDLSCNQSLEILAIGAGAYGFINGYQFRNSSQSELFKQQINTGNYFEVDAVSVQSSLKNLMERYMIHNFYSSSVNRYNFKKRFGRDPLTEFEDIFRKLSKYNLVAIDNTFVRLTKLGKKWRRSIYYEFHS